MSAKVRTSRGAASSNLGLLGLDNLSSKRRIGQGAMTTAVTNVFSS